MKTRNHLTPPHSIDREYKYLDNIHSSELRVRTLNPESIPISHETSNFKTMFKQYVSFVWITTTYSITTYH